MRDQTLPGGLSPADVHNQRLADHVRPEAWVNPTPKGRYNLVVIGAGTAGLVTAAGAAGLGAKVALVEKDLMGGDCLNFGCVPSKAVIRSGRAAFDVRNAVRFGVNVAGEPEIDFAAVMDRMRKIRADISHHDSAERFRDLGIDVYIGAAQFASSDSVRVGDTELKFSRAVICTGAKAVHPPIDGLKDTGYLTNETVFNLTEQPKRLAVIGGGPIGCELAQTFARLGTEVTIVEMADQFLVREDPDAAAIVKTSLERDGIEIRLSTGLKKVTSSDGGKVLHLEKSGAIERVEVDEILVGVGRAPNVKGLGLENVDVDFDPRSGVIVDDRLRTTNAKIFAAGDVCSPYKFTHAADFAARAVIANALFFGRRKFSALNVPWCTYTDPEVAHVGMYEEDASDKGIQIDTYIKHFKEVDRALAEGDEEGFVKIHTQKGSDKILGATIVARHAGEMLSEITMAMNHDIGLGSIANVIHPYPTQAEAIRHLGDEYNRTRLTPFVSWLFDKILSWRR